MNLISSDIVTTEYDVFWQDASELVKNMQASPVLIVTSGNPEDVQLRKMLDACKLQQGQFNILSLEEGRQVAWHKLKHALAVKVVLLLGVMPARLGVSALFRLCEPNKFDGVVWLPAPSIGDMEKEPEVKKQLWVAGMKPTFIDKVYGDLLSAEVML